MPGAWFTRLYRNTVASWQKNTHPSLFNVEKVWSLKKLSCHWKWIILARLFHCSNEEKKRITWCKPLQAQQLFRSYNGRLMVNVHITVKETTTDTVSAIGMWWILNVFYGHHFPGLEPVVHQFQSDIHDLCIGEIPILVGSIMCHTDISQQKKANSTVDPLSGCYFIINGQAKVIVNQPMHCVVPRLESDELCSSVFYSMFMWSHLRFEARCMIWHEYISSDSNRVHLNYFYCSGDGWIHSALFLGKTALQLSTDFSLHRTIQ